MRNLIYRKIAVALAAVLSFSASTRIEAVSVGDAVPSCTLNSIDGKQAIDTAALKGKVVYLDFWASWCGPCAKSFPFMNELHHDLSAKGLVFVGVNLDENIDDAKAFLAQHPVNFTITKDNEESCAKQFDVKAMPSSYLIGRDGSIRHIHLGFRKDEGKELRDMVEKLLAEQLPATAGN